MYGDDDGGRDDDGWGPRGGDGAAYATEVQSLPGSDDDDDDDDDRGGGPCGRKAGATLNRATLL